MIRHRILPFVALAGAFASPCLALQGQSSQHFQRIATFPVYLNTDVDDETVAEIVAATPDGNTLVYTDSETEKLGFVDITDPANPQPAGAIDLPGEPTAVSVRGNFALVGVNTSADFIDTSGELVVIDIQARTIVRSLDLGGQPDSVAVSPDGQYAAVAIENERDEDLGDGEPPQLPAGFLVIVDLVGDDAANWSTRNVDLTGIAPLFPDDPEPEFVDINRFNLCAVTLQENNHVVIVSLALGRVLTSFSAGTVDFTDIDVDEEGVIDQTASLDAVPREPDAIAWVGNFALATADEGDLFGGSRGFTNWTVLGSTIFEAGNSLEHGTARAGHYPEERSGNKGNEPEGVEYGEYGSGDRFLFVGSERSNLVFVYRLLGGGLLGASQPVLEQVLPTGVGPEGLLAIPDRDLFVVACEKDDRGDKFRSSIMIYSRNGQGDYPSISSVDRDGTSGVPIPWGALSALAGDPADDTRIYTAHDSFYGRSRILELDTDAAGPGVDATIVREMTIEDTSGLLRFGLERQAAVLPGTDDFDIDALVNADGTVNVDIEGLAIAEDGVSLWAATEGRGNLVGGVSDPDDRPFESPNFLIRLAPTNASPALSITSVIGLPPSVTRNQLRFGFEGVTTDPVTGDIYVCFQRSWQASGDAADHARIGKFSASTREWTFAHYPLGAPTFPNGGWVGLSEITRLDDGRLAILECDNQGGPDASIKRIYTVDPSSVTFAKDGSGPIPDLAKTLAVDLIAAGAFDRFNGFAFEKLEGMAVLSNGDVILVNDNGGVDDNSGETRLFTIPAIF